MIFHDFDYINPVTMMPEGRNSNDYQTNRSLQSFNPQNAYGAQSSTRHKKFGTTGMSSQGGKSVYVSEMPSEKKVKM